MSQEKDDVPVIMTPEHIAILKNMVGNFLLEKPDATTEEISDRCTKFGYRTIDMRMFEEWLTTNGFKQ